MLKFVLPVALALLVPAAPAQAGHKCKCHHVHKQHRIASRPAKLVRIITIAPTVKTRRVTTTTTVTRTVHYSPPQVVERPVYVDRPVYVERPVYYERRVPVYRPIPVYHTRTIVAHPRSVYRRTHYWRSY